MAKKAPQNGTANLRPQTTRTKEEQRLVATRGGVRSGEVRRERAALRKSLQNILDARAKAPAIQAKIESTVGLSTETNTDLLAARMFAAAMAGDVKAMVEIAKISGQYTEKIEVEATVVQPVELSIGELKAKLDDFNND